MELPAKVLFLNGKPETYLEAKKGTDVWIQVTDSELKTMAKRAAAKKAIKISKEPDVNLDALKEKKERKVIVADGPEIDLDKEEAEKVLQKAKQTAQKAKLKNFLLHMVSKKREMASKQTPKAEPETEPAWKTAARAATNKPLEQQIKELKESIKRVEYTMKERGVDSIEAIETGRERLKEDKKTLRKLQIKLLFEKGKEAGKETSNKKVTSKEKTEESGLTKDYYDKLLKEKELEYERWSKLPFPKGAGAFEAYQEEDKLRRKEINKLKKLRKEAPVAVSEEDYPQHPSSSPQGVDATKLFMYQGEMLKVRGHETRGGKPKGVSVYELVQENPPRFKSVYERWNGGKYPYQRLSGSGYIQRKATWNPKGYYMTDVSRGEKKGDATKDGFEDLYPYKPSDKELHWLRTGEYK